MITQTQIDEVVEAIVQFYRPEKIILFGSYATGMAKEDSDLDLAVIKTTKEPFHKRGAQVRQAIRRNGKIYYFPKDILMFTPVEMKKLKDDPYSVVYEILKTGKTLYERVERPRLAN